MINAYQHHLIHYAEGNSAISVLPLFELAEKEKVVLGDLHHWIVRLKHSDEHKHLFRQDLPTGPHWTHVAIPAASSVQDYDEPTVITIEGTRHRMGQQVISPRIRMAYYFATETQAREWWYEHRHKLEKHIRGLESRLLSLYTPEDPD